MIKRNFMALAMAAAAGALAIAGWAASAPEDDWKMSGPFGGTASSVAVDPENPQTVLAGAINSLLYRSDDAGADWTLVDFPKRTLSEVTSLLVDPNDSQHYLAGMTAAEGGGLFESHDRGATWTAVPDIKDFGVRALAASASNPARFVAGTLHGVMLSDDSGKSWKRISDPENHEMEGITSVAIDTQNPDIIYAGTAHLPWKTTDAGKTWESIHTGMIDDSDVFSIYVEPTAPANILASACSGIYASGDRGEQWRKLMGIPNTSRRTHVVREDPANPMVIYAGTTTGLYKSMNHGTSWRTLTNTQVNSITFAPGTPHTMYLALEFEGVGKSNDGGEAFEDVNKGFVDRQITALTRSGSRVVALQTQLGETSGLFTTRDEGRTWTQMRNNKGLAGVHLKAITGLATDEHILLAASTHQMYKSTDSGVTWKPLPVRRLIPPAPDTAKPQPKTTARTARSRTTRRPVARPVAPKPVIKEIFPSEISGLYAFKNDSKDVLFAATDLGLLRSDNAGEHWTLIEVPQNVAVNALYAAPGSAAHMILKGSGGLYASTDCGEHWTQISFPLPVTDIYDVAIGPDDNAPLLVATRLGLYASSDNGGNWTNKHKGLPASTVSAVAYSAARHAAYAVEYGQLYEAAAGAQEWSLAPTTLRGLRIRQLWMGDETSRLLYGLTSDLGILIRE